MISIFAPRLAASLVLLGSITASLPANAGEAAKELKEIVKPESRYKLSGWIEAGITFNGDRPKDHQNFGHFTTDRANELLLNQAVLTFERALVPEPGQFDWGFKFQGLFGSDARILHTFGVLDNTMHEIMQPDIVEAFVSFHAPFLTEGGFDLKVGQFVTLLGNEVVTAPGNFFYTHTYSSNFGLPFKHVGALSTFHATPWLDLHAGFTRGINAGWTDNNDVLSFIGGFGVKLFGDKLTILGSTHIGAENDSIYAASGIDTNGAMRHTENLIFSWKATDKLTSITELTYGADDGFDAEWYAAVQYLTYTVNDYVSLGLRGEVYRDDDGFTVLQSANNEDVANLQRGILDNLDPRTVGGGDTTYGAITVGANLKLPGALKDHVLIRPEVRYDNAISGARNRPFDDSTDRDQFTVSVDVIVLF
ncbi:MAG: outer membrane beta-barrel protein [Verrucomicrobiota bacterium]